MNKRREPRYAATETYDLCWQDHDGRRASAEVECLNRSRAGILINFNQELPAGAVVYLQAKGGSPAGYCVVRHSSPRGNGYAIGLEFNEETPATFQDPEGETVNYYEFLQISPKADLSTIQRIYRILASRFHPDNPETGDPEKFLLLQAAYKVLSDLDRRAAYDATLHQNNDPGILPIFELSEFVNGIEGEVNRRLGVLALLYNRRRTSPHSPGISLFDLEKRMGMPREYLEFTTWYLKAKQYITVADNSDFALTASGIDYVESNVQTTPILQKLLHSGPRSTTSAKPAASNDPARRADTKRLSSPATEKAEPSQNQ